MSAELKFDAFASLSDNIFAMKELENPADLMEQVIEDVNEAFETLYDDYNMSYDEFYAHLEFHNDDLCREIDELWDDINCDIYDHYEHGTLFSFELDNWKSELFGWKEKIVAAIRDIVQTEFCADFPAGQAQMYVNAA
ncbi:hypothetical protein JXA02_01305 [candidate division KSB1 bacterium]|nr:hypothetical protein [candidate division KSB1 bacterium]RQW11018.1 MAG: hypothetical protein EH222_01415 [candidate division KSB1 bacterium]